MPHDAQMSPQPVRTDDSRAVWWHSSAVASVTSALRARWLAIRSTTMSEAAPRACADDLRQFLVARPLGTRDRRRACLLPRRVAGVGFCAAVRRSRGVETALEGGRGVAEDRPWRVPAGSRTGRPRAVAAREGRCSARRSRDPPRLAERGCGRSRKSAVETCAADGELEVETRGHRRLASAAAATSRIAIRRRSRLDCDAAGVDEGRP